MKFLIAGLGSIGRRHLRNLTAIGESDIVLLRRPPGGMSADGLEGFPVETELQTALDCRPDAVIITNPTALHLDVAIPAAEAGCHLLIEKPVSHSMERIADLQAAVGRGGGQVLVGYQFRFHPGLQRIKQILDQESLGKPVSFRARWGEYLPGWHPWEDYRQGYSARRDLGGGVVLTLSHPLDYARWLFGEVESLWAYTARRGGLELDVEDTAEIGLQFENGTLGSIHLDYLEAPGSHSLEVLGTQGTLRWNNADGIVHTLSFGDETGESHPSLEGAQRNRLFLAEMSHFRDLIRGTAEPVCSLDDGIEALRMALGVHHSAGSGHSWRRM